MDAAMAASEGDLKKLETALSASIRNAGDLAALEDLRVGALGKNGSVTGLLKSLGAMAPEERKSFGAAVNGLKQRVTELLEERKEGLQRAALAKRAWPAGGGTDPPDQPGLGRDHRDLRRSGLRRRRRAGP
jgi:phenylalanyl-tRNA synthetase alpha subunit